MKDLIAKKDLKQISECYGGKDSKKQEIAMVYLMYTSGMRTNDIRNLTFFDFVKSLDEYFYNDEISPYRFEKIASSIKKREDVIGRWKMHNYKTGMQYETFCTTETMKAIVDWLEIKKEGKINIRFSEPLFNGSNGEKLTRENFQNIFKQMNNRCGINIRPHDLRKLFVETLRYNKVPEEYIGHFLGQNKNPVSDITITDCDLLKNSYRRATSELSFNQRRIMVPIEHYFYLRDNVKCMESLLDWL